MRKNEILHYPNEIFFVVVAAENSINSTQFLNYPADSIITECPKHLDIVFIRMFIHAILLGLSIVGGKQQTL